MNKAIETPETIPYGTAIGGGFFSGFIRINGELVALISAPKAEGEIREIWNDNYKNVAGATSFFDGLANTKAMADAGSPLAKWALELRIGGNDDWYIPSQDEKEVIYRYLKPSTDQNSQYGRSGINVSAEVPTYPYTPDSPAQTTAKNFQSGGEEAFEEGWYWTSTQHPAYSDCAFCQSFEGGGQNSGYKGNKLLARAVRRLTIESFNALVRELEAA